MVAYGLWCAVRRCSSTTRLCGASGTGYVSLGGLISSGRWPMVAPGGGVGRYAVTLCRPRRRRRRSPRSAPTRPRLCRDA
eukprot:1371202-Prymnesium_polylepis.1